MGVYFNDFQSSPGAHFSWFHGSELGFGTIQVPIFSWFHGSELGFEAHGGGSEREHQETAGSLTKMATGNSGFSHEKHQFFTQKR